MSDETEKERKDLNATGATEQGKPPADAEDVKPEAASPDKKPQPQPPIKWAHHGPAFASEANGVIDNLIASGTTNPDHAYRVLKTRMNIMTGDARIMPRYLQDLLKLRGFGNSH